MRRTVARRTSVTGDMILCFSVADMVAEEEITHTNVDTINSQMVVL
jgi:hypothetical protein